MPAAATDLLMEVGDPGTATTLSAPGYTIGNTSVTVGSTSNWPTATGVIFAMDEVETVDGVETQVEGSYNEYAGTVASGTSVTNVSHQRGTNRNYSAGASTRVYIPVSAERENRIVEWGLLHADQDGTLKAGAVDSAAVLASDVVTTAKILNSNVTTAKIADGNVTTVKIADANVTSEKLSATIGFIARRTTNQGITGGVTTKVECATEDKDFGSDYDNATNYRFVAPVAGFYHFSGTVTTSAVPERLITYLYKNGALEVTGHDIETSVAGGALSSIVVGEIYLAATDYVELFVLLDDTTNVTAARFSGYLVGAG